MKDKYDFNRVGLLLHVVEKTSGYPNLRDIGASAMDELNAMVKEATEAPPKVVTPAAGPADSAIENRDGSVTQQMPIPPRADSPEERERKHQEAERRFREGEAHRQSLINPSVGPVDVDRKV